MVTRSKAPSAPAPNLSRGAGEPAPQSAAASAPMSGAFYSPGAEPAATSGLAAAAAGPDFNASARGESVALERGGTADRAVVEHLAGDAITDASELEAEIERIRLIRKPLGAYSQKLALPQRRGYHRHWFNDVAGRIEEATNNGWSPVTGTDGKPISRCVGSGRDKGALYAFAMELPEVFWLEDQAARNAAAAEKIDSLKRAPFQAAPGSAKASDKGKFYDPSETEAGPLQVVKGS